MTYGRAGDVLVFPGQRSDRMGIVTSLSGEAVELSYADPAWRARSFVVKPDQVIAEIRWRAPRAGRAAGDAGLRAGDLGGRGAGGRSSRRQEAAGSIPEGGRCQETSAAAL